MISQEITKTKAKTGINTNAIFVFWRINFRILLFFGARHRNQTKRIKH
jgi:hypothetical protein